MPLTGQEIRALRQRLGWSLAEMARQMGCTTELVTRWETGSALPEPESLYHLQHLRIYAENICEKIMQDPVVEILIESEGLAQLTRRDLFRDY